ncbi:MAG: histidine kinase dimerization/phospho-acceptor domain-containing protein, partial [Chloroflexota bacterium]
MLRVRLVALALGVTLLILSERSDQLAAGTVLLGYAVAVMLQRFSPVARGNRGLQVLGLAFDILYATGLAVLLPATAATWVLYAFAIGTAALRFGAVGAAAGCGASIFAYDLGLAVRPEALAARDLWPVQLLLALGVVTAELAWSAHRVEELRARMSRFAIAQRDLIAAADETALLARLTDHAVRTFEARGAWVEDADGIARHVRGETSAAGDMPLGLVIADRPALRLYSLFADGPTAERGGAGLRDLATDTAPLLDAARARATLARSEAVLTRVLEGIGSLERDRVANAVLAQVVVTAGEIAGTATIVRPSDGTVVAGDGAANEVAAIARDRLPPLIVSAGPLARTAAVVAVGQGLSLVATGTRRDLGDADLHALQLLGAVAGAAIERLNERSAIIGRGAALEREASELSDQLRKRDDAVAVAVHELRTPLTSVRAYAQLTSRNLQAVQRQVTQLDRLIADLLRVPGEGALTLDLGAVDLVQETRQAARQVQLVAGRRVDVDVRGDGPFIVAADRGRVGQILENLLSNAVKFSPATSEIEIALEHLEGDVVLSVRDH